MGHLPKSKLLCALLFISCTVVGCFADSVADVTRRTPLTEWRFHSGDLPAPPTREDSKEWRTVQVPHDWSIEGKTDAAAPGGGGGGFFPTGIGWYVTEFDRQPSWANGRLRVHFEAAYRQATVWLNGQRLGTHAYGYTPFAFDLGPHLREGANTLAVRIENEPQPNSRYYSGSGLIRPVRLEWSAPVDFVPDSLWAKTIALDESGATIEVEGELESATDLTETLETEVSLTLAPITDSEETVASWTGKVALKPGKPGKWSARLMVDRPLLWSPATPSNRYRLIAAVSSSNSKIDGRQSIDLGIRQLRWSAEQGMELNGEPITLFGGNVHHDHGALGAAAYPDAEWRKVQILRNAGFNAVRTSHNPPATAFLEACDALGMLVIDEAFDGWRSKKVAHDYGEIFDENWEDDLASLVRRDRNHPSVIAWSVGNEVYERGSAKGVRIAHEMAAVVRSLDTSRPVTIGLNGLATPEEWPRLDALFDTFDLAGYNYELARHTEDHERRPNRIIYASESYLHEAYGNWKIVQAHPYVIGDFVWSAIDYLGEAGIGRVFPPGEEARKHWEGSHYPWHGGTCGDIGITGWRKPISLYRQLVWDPDGPTLALAVEVPTPSGEPWELTPWSVKPMVRHWTWPEQESRPLKVEVYSRHERVRLRLNGKLVGEAATSEATQFKAGFEVPYVAEDLRVEGIDGGKVTATRQLRTAGPPSRLKATLEPLPAEAVGELAFVRVEIADTEGVRVPSAENRILAITDGPGRVLAIASDDLSSTEPYQADRRTTFDGRALVVVQRQAPGSLRLRLEADGLEPTEIEIP